MSHRGPRLVKELEVGSREEIPHRGREGVREDPLDDPSDHVPRVILLEDGDQEFFGPSGRAWRSKRRKASCLTDNVCRRREGSMTFLFINELGGVIRTSRRVEAFHLFPRCSRVCRRVEGGFQNFSRPRESPRPDQLGNPFDNRTGEAVGEEGIWSDGFGPL